MPTRPTSHRSALGLALALALGLGACATTRPVATDSPRSVRHVDPAQVSGPYVPAGVRFRARINDTIDTRANGPGQPFSAVVETPLRTATGAVLVPAGAILRGHVRSTGSDTSPRIRLHLDSVDTTVGPVALEAQIDTAEYRAYAGPPQYRVATPPAYDPYYTGSVGMGWGARPYGGGPGPAFVGSYYEQVIPREIQLGRGATIEFVLTRPLLAPGSRILDD